MKLLKFTEQKYPMVKDRHLLEVLAGCEAFNPNLPDWVEVPARPLPRHQIVKEKRRLARRKAEHES